MTLFKFCQVNREALSVSFKFGKLSKFEEKFVFFGKI